MNYRLLFLISFSLYSNLSIGQLGLTEGLKMTFSFGENEFFNAENIEEIRREKGFFKGLIYTEKFDKRGRIISQIYETEKADEPYRKCFWAYNDQEAIKVTMENTYEKWDTTSIISEIHQNDKLLKEEKKRINRYKKTVNGVSEIVRSERLSTTIYTYDDFNNLLSEIRRRENENDTIEINQYQYSDKNQLLTKKHKHQFFGKEVINDYFYEYDDDGNLLKETISEDSLQVIYYFENQQKVKSEFYKFGKLEFESFYNEQENIERIKIYENQKFVDIIDYEYILDDKNNWTKIIIHTSLENKLPKEISRTIKYRE